MTQPETAPTFVRHDRWLLWPLAVALPAVIWLWWCIVWNAEALTTLLVAFVNVVAFCAAVIALLVHLVTRRFRAALWALAGAAIIAGGFVERVAILNAARYTDFAIHRAGYERAVEMWRAKHPGSGPLRLVLDTADRSTFVVPTIFDYIVYDESDAIGCDPADLSGNWRCATQECGNGMINAGRGRFVVKAFGDHFYFIEETL